MMDKPAPRTAGLIFACAVGAVGSTLMSLGLRSRGHSFDAGSVFVFTFMALPYLGTALAGFLLASYDISGKVRISLLVAVVVYFVLDLLTHLIVLLDPSSTAALALLVVSAASFVLIPVIAAISFFILRLASNR